MVTVEELAWDELDKAKDSLYCAIQQKAYDRILLYTEVVRVLTRILERNRDGRRRTDV